MSTILPASAKWCRFKRKNAMTDFKELQAAGLEFGSLIRRLRLFHELFDELLCEAYQNGYFRWVNVQWQRHLGWTFEELTSRPWISFVHPDDFEITVNRNNNIVEAGQTIILTVTNPKSKAGAIFVQIAAHELNVQAV